MRLRTLPVSVAGVILAIGFNLHTGTFRALPALLCLAFATLAQIASNFANEYYDYVRGFDRRGRVGPRRGVTEGDITPRAMKLATFITLAVACGIGCCLLAFGGWWLLPVGIFIAAGVYMYSAGPYPLSHHGLGEVAVILFFGIIPVCLTYYVQALTFSIPVVLASVSAGLMGANVLIVNNYRDADDDREVGKHTLAVKWGRRVTGILYLINGYLAGLLMCGTWGASSAGLWAIPALYLLLHTLIWRRLTTSTGRALNPLLGMTAMLMLAYCAAFTVAQAV